MSEPTVTVLPLRAGVSSDSETTLDVMVRITPPPMPARAERPLLNLALVIDRSSSMAGKKLAHAKRAARYAVENLLPEDRVSVIAYGQQVETVAPSALAHDKEAITRSIDAITASGMTALHAGWLAGAEQVGTHLDAGRLNRVILLSDGQANVGVTDPDVIASDINGLVRHGISTSAIGVGRDFNEDLMQAVATSGDGNFYFIESPEQLPAIFEAELQGLVATRGRDVRLAFTSDHGATVREVLNDFVTDERGQLILPNLVSGMPLLLAVTLQVPPLTGGAPIGELHLSWVHPESGRRSAMDYRYSLPSMPSVKLQALPSDPEVEGYFAELRATRVKQAGIASLDRGDRQAALRKLEEARALIHAAPESERTHAELRELDRLAEALQRQDDVIARKRMHDQVYRKRYSRDLEAAQAAHGSATPQNHGQQLSSPQIGQQSPGQQVGQQVPAHQRNDPRNPGPRIAVKVGDLTQEHADAIVNPTNTGLFGTGGVDGAVHRAGGPELTRACREIGRCEPGEAVFTDGFRLPARFVIHTVGPKWQGRRQSEARVLASCYRNSLQLARRLGVRSVAFPSISTGTYGYPVAEAAEVAVAEIQRFLAHEPGLEVRIVCFDRGTAAAYERALLAAGLNA